MGIAKTISHLLLSFHGLLFFPLFSSTNDKSESVPAFARRWRYLPEIGDLKRHLPENGHNNWEENVEINDDGIDSSKQKRKNN